MDATIVRLLVQWNLVAPQRPTRPTDPFDPAYVFDDVDEAVRAAQENDQEVILTLSGTPRWANGGKNPNVMPTRVCRLHALLACDSSRATPGASRDIPFVRFWSVWNEPNLQLFLSPQFDARGRSVAPANYARLVRGRIQRDQGRKRAVEGRDRRDVRSRERQARRVSDRRIRRASSPSSSRRRIRD